MKLTRPTLAKAKWLTRTPAFRTSPIKTIFRVISWEFLRILNKPILSKFDRSLSIRLFPNDGVARLTYYFDYHEPEIFRFLDKYLKPGMTFIDVGANIGVYTLFAGKRVGLKGKVIAFEPQPETFNRLIENIELNRLTNIVAKQVAVGETSGKVEIVKHTDTSKSYTRIIRPTIDQGSQDLSIYAINMISLDKYLCSHQFVKIDYLKIDVEGFELNVLKGAKHILEKLIPSIIEVELIDEFQKRCGNSIKMVLNFLSNLGYHFFHLNGVSLKLVSLQTQEQPDVNVFLIHESKLYQFREFVQ